MAVVYVSARVITEPGEPEQVVGVWEFEHEAWESALAMAYEWLREYRKPTCAYRIWA